MSNEKRAPGCLGYVRDEILPSCIGIIINHSKDPYLFTNQYGSWWAPLITDRPATKIRNTSGRSALQSKASPSCEVEKTRGTQHQGEDENDDDDDDDHDDDDDDDDILNSELENLRESDPPLPNQSKGKIGT